MANELGQYNITVNSILPGSTKTQRLQSLIKNTAIISNKSIETVEQEMQKEIPMKRFADPSELAAVVAFLASPAASYVNGISIPVDGGRTGNLVYSLSFELFKLINEWQVNTNDKQQTKNKNES